jgi:hypothetical protein
MKKWVVLLALAACSSSHGGVAGDAGPGGSGADAPIADAPGDAKPPGDPFKALAALPAQCSADHWCWRDPTPSGNDYAHIYATAPDNLWLVGQYGTVMQWDGAAWHAHHPPALAGQQASQQYAFSISGRGPDDMWLIYGTTLQHWDGQTWTIRDSAPTTGNPAFDSVWEAPNGDVWATMSNGQIDRALGGGAFVKIDTGCNCFLGTIWGLAANDFWMTALPGKIIHSDGHAFTPSVDTPAVVGSFAGAAGNDVWCTGTGGVAMHWNGATWTQVPTGLVDGFILGMTALATNDVWWWQQTSSASSVLLHWDGTTLTKTAIDTTAVGRFLYSAAIIDGRFWFVGGGGAVYTKTDANAVAPIVDPHTNIINDIWGTSADDLYFTDGGEIFHWNGTAQTTIPIAAAYLSGVRVGGADELFAVGHDVTADHLGYVASAYHFDGATWTKAPLVTSTFEDVRLFTRVFAMGPGEAMAVGSKGIAYHFTGGVWSAIDSGVTSDLLGVWGPDADHLWVTGAHGTLLRWDRATPDVLTPDPTAPATTDDLGAIHGAGGVTWIATSNINVLRNTGAGWTTVETACGPGCWISARGVFAIDANNVVLSSAGTSQLARWNGKGFALEDSGNAVASPVIFQPPGGPMLAGGSHGFTEHP